MIKNTIRALVRSGVTFSEFWERNSDPKFFGKTKEIVWLLWLHEEVKKTFEDVEDSRDLLDEVLDKITTKK